MTDFPSRLIAAEDKAAAQIEADFLKSIRITVSETDWSKLERDFAAYQHGDAIIDGIAWEDFDPAERLKDLFSVSLAINGANIGKLTGGAKFDFVDPRALTWIDNHCADLIVQIDNKTKDAIKQIVKNGYANGVTPKNQARAIREMIGLDPQRAATLEKYTDNLFSKGKSEAEVWRLTEKKGRALLNARANLIAINETSEASANATYWSTKSAVERGVLSKDEWEEYRIVAADERLCSRCAPIAGEGRELPDGMYPSTGSITAKVHVKCRCCGGLRMIGTKKKKEMKESGRTQTDVVFEAKALKRKDGIIYCPTVPLVEGVFSGLGIPVLRLYEEFSKDAKWLQGLTVLTNHEDLSPSSRRIGQLVEPKPRPDTKDIAAITQFYEIDLTQREIENITSQKPIHGSLALSYNLESVSGDYNGVHYEAIERGPYVFYEYSMVREGIVTPEQGAGFNMECKGCKNPSHNHNHQPQSSAPGGADMEIEEIQSMIDESTKPLKEQIATLEAEKEVLKGEQTKIKDQAVADKNARVFESFQGKLKAGHLAEAQKHFEAYQADPAAWVLENADKFIQPAQEKKLQGSAMAGEGGGQPVTLEEANKAHQEKMTKLNQEMI